MTVLRNRLPVLVLLVAAVIFVAAGPMLLDRYTVNVLVRSFLYAIAVLTVDVLWGYTGILIFGQSAMFGIGAYAAGLVFTHLGFSPGLAALALGGGVLAAMAVAWLVGWVSFWHRASPLYVAVVTLVLPIVVVQLLYSGGKFTGSSSGLVGFESFFLSTEQWFWITGGLLIAFTIVAWCFVNSDFGRVLVAIRENEARCQFLGIHTTRIKSMLLMVMGAVAAVAGYAYACYSVVVAPEIAGFVFGTELVIYAALGGRGTLVGPVVGAVAIDLTSAYLSGSLPYVWKLIVGVIFVAVIVLLPHGFAPLVRSVFLRVLKLVGLGRGGAGQDAASDIVLERIDSSLGQAGAGSTAAPLEVSELSRHYGSLKVLDGVSFSARASEVLSLVGPNGAGKTTLMRCLSSGTERTGGTVRVNGVDIARAAPQALARLGIGRSFQNTSLFDSLSVGESLLLARARIDGLKLFSRRRTVRLPEPALRILKATGLDQRLGERTSNLSHGMKRALELAMVLGTEPSVLLLDEPTAGLSKEERSFIGDVLTELAQRDGLCILLIEHDLDFVREISSRVIVLHEGSLLLDGPVEEVVASELVAAVYAGQSQAVGA